jgi:hypothetical protein
MKLEMLDDFYCSLLLQKAERLCRETLKNLKKDNEFSWFLNLELGKSFVLSGSC